MKILINYADSRYAQARKWNSRTGKLIAKFDTIYEFSPNDIDDKFQKENRQILLSKRGNGLWLWKPYIINKVLEHTKDGDFIFYCDSGAFFIRNIDTIKNQVNKETPLFVCDIPLIESCFTKPECFDEMECKEDFFHTSNQIIATYLGIYVCPKSRQFIYEWLNLCCRYSLISPAGNIELNINKNYGDSFVAHREDQSIFSLLCKKHHISPHKDISQRGNDPESYHNSLYTYKVPIHEKDIYKPIIYLHKSPRLTLGIFAKRLLKKIACRLLQRK